MAITRTQIAKQLLANGGRTGFFSGGIREGDDISPGTSTSGGIREGRDPSKSGQGANVRPTNIFDEVALTSSANRNFMRDARNAVTPIGDRLFSKVPFSGGIVGSLAKGALNLFSPSPFGYSSPTPVDFSGMDRGGDVPLWAQLGFSSEAEYLAALARASGETEQVVEGDSTEEKLFDDDRFRRFRADGGRIGFFKAGLAQGDEISPGTAASSSRDGPTRRDDGPKGPTGSGGDKGPKFDIFSPIDSMKAIQRFKLGLKPEDIAIAKKIKEEEDNKNLFTPGVDQSTVDTLLNPDAAANFQKITTETSDLLKADTDLMKTLGLAKAEGGIMNPDIIGGEMDFESARQMYGLGKLVKKVTRSVKKIAKSPIGKAALLYAGTAGLGAFGAGAAKAGSGFGIFSPGNVFKNIVSSGKNLGLLKRLTGVGKDGTEYLTRVGPLANLGVGSLMAGTSLLAGLLTPEQEEEAEELARGEGIDIEEARRSILNAGTAQDFRARRFVAEGGSMKEPVAKKTMPLLDMGGKEMDLRAEGGFVPIGRMEKADDVPARLSKNEFVFTADAVRNAGDGDVDKGAEVMYNMMKNLEAGGDVSEESQGLEGARRMFQTSQRLEEVL